MMLTSIRELSAATITLSKNLLLNLGDLMLVTMNKLSILDATICSKRSPRFKPPFALIAFLDK